MDTNFRRSNEVAAAWIRVEPILAAKQRGDDVTRAEIIAVSDGVAIERLEAKVRRHFLARGIDPRPIVNVGWHLPTDEEQVHERTEHHRGRARRETRKELAAAIRVDETKLTPEGRRLRDLHIRHAGAALTAQRATTEDRKTVLGAPPPRPQLKTARKGE